MPLAPNPESQNQFALGVRKRWILETFIEITGIASALKTIQCCAAEKKCDLRELRLQKTEGSWCQMIYGKFAVTSCLIVSQV